VRNEVVLALQSRIGTLAARYTRYGNGTCADWLDLSQAATVAMLETFSQAVTKRNLFAYLVGVARIAMIACISGHDDLIKTHHHTESITVLSLDHPAREGSLPGNDVLLSAQEERQKDEYYPLYRAIEALPQAYRIVIERHYGFGSVPETLDAISARLGKPSAPRPSVAHARKRQALALMRKYLAGIYA
jgi:DNA-directed RNA polymerase specialized sigma24 family protein